ncbi:MAG TPA: hypothetical protein VFS17_09240 [Methylophilaceae bacterium]|nr:hypothetical protein [Methylophilaceae bacterium]
MKLSELSDTAKEEPPISHQIAALEQQIQHHKARIKSRSYALEYKARSKLASPSVLLLSAGAGFLGERLLRRSSQHAHATQQSQGKSRAQTESMLSQVMKAAAMVQAVLASYPVVQLTKYLAQQKTAGKPTTSPASTRQPMPETTAYH